MEVETGWTAMMLGNGKGQDRPYEHSSHYQQVLPIENSRVNGRGTPNTEPNKSLKFND